MLIRLFCLELIDSRSFCHLVYTSQHEIFQAGFNQGGGCLSLGESNYKGLQGKFGGCLALVVCVQSLGMSSMMQVAKMFSTEAENRRPQTLLSSV